MDYNYIKCLIQRYFECETTLEEEQILHKFFMQDSLPAELQQYKALFTTFEAEAETELPADFDEQLQARIQSLETASQKTVAQPIVVELKSGAQQNASAFKARLVTFNRNLSPFYKAVASIALIITVGVVSNRYWASNSQEPAVYNYSSYQDTYNNPKEACAEVVGALKDLSTAFKDGNTSDSADVKNVETQIMN